MWKAAMDLVAGIFKPATDLIDNIHTSEEEKLELRNVLVKLQNEVTTKQIDLLRAYFSRRLSATQKASWKGTNHVCMAY